MGVEWELVEVADVIATEEWATVHNLTVDADHDRGHISAAGPSTTCAVKQLRLDIIRSVLREAIGPTCRDLRPDSRSS